MNRTEGNDMVFIAYGATVGGRVDGVGTVNGGVYNDLHINGVCTVDGDLEAESLKINGVCTCTGNVTAKVFNCDGVLTVSGNLRAGTADIDGICTVNGKKVEADRIKCDGVLSVDGEISADVIEAEGKVNAAEIVGDSIRIKSYWKNRGPLRALFRLGEKANIKYSAVDLNEGLLVKRMSMKFSVIDLIEGTTVELRGVHAKSVRGRDVRIEKDCEIDHVDASGELVIHQRARVGEVIKP
jgi:cytoskeletal protein CcmA (bactofilin family)